MDVLNKVPVREQEPKVRATNFDEVCLGYNKDEAVEEASRCIGCKNAKCIEGCPESTGIVPQMILSIEVLPEPLLPTTDRNSPSCMVRLKFSNRQSSLTVPGL